MRVPGMAVVEYIRSDVSPSSPYIVVGPRGRSGRVAVQLVENAQNAPVCILWSRTESLHIQLWVNRLCSSSILRVRAWCGRSAPVADVTMHLCATTSSFYLVAGRSRRVFEYTQSSARHPSTQLDLFRLVHIICNQTSADPPKALT